MADICFCNKQSIFSEFVEKTTILLEVISQGVLPERGIVTLLLA